MEKAIIIGGSGFLGSHLLGLLQKENVEVLAVTNKKPVQITKTTSVFKGGISAVNIQLIDDFKPDAIFHCARPTLPRYRKFGRILAAKKAYKLNKKLIQNIEKAEQKPKLIFASGSLIYGNSSKPHDELSPQRPISYARQYHKGEIPINEAILKNSFPVIVLRFPWLLGNGSWFKWFYLENSKKSKSVPTFGDQKNRMEIIDVKDAAKLMQLHADEAIESGFFNITSRNPKTQFDFVKEVKEIFDATEVDYRELFPKGLEKEAMEAFTSNITLSTLRPEILDKFQFSSIKETLKCIKSENEIRN
jgi:nucleoside-diphosphate-sugar epimerase